MRILNKLVNGVTLPDINAQPNMISRELFEKIEKLPDDSTFEMSLLVFLRKNYKTKIICFDVEFLDRKFGTGTNEKFLQKLNYSFKTIKSIFGIRTNKC
jgi:hypothetical protein